MRPRRTTEAALGACVHVLSRQWTVECSLTPDPDAVAEGTGTEGRPRPKALSVERGVQV